MLGRVRQFTIQFVWRNALKGERAVVFFRRWYFVIIHKKNNFCSVYFKVFKRSQCSLPKIATLFSIVSLLDFIWKYFVNIFGKKLKQLSDSSTCFMKKGTWTLFLAWLICFTSVANIKAVCRHKLYSQMNNDIF